MNFMLTTTGFLAAGALIAVPIILHFLNRRPPESIDFPAFDFLKAAECSKSRRYSLRQWLLLLLRMAIILLLAYAFCRPYLSSHEQLPANATVLLWDDSFSMTATPFRQKLYQDAIDRIAQCDKQNPMQIGIIRDKSIIWSGAFSGNRRVMKTWFEQNIRNQGTAVFDQVIIQADFRLREIIAKNKKIILITDRQQLPWERVQAGEKLSPGVEFSVIWPEPPIITNAAITNIEIPGIVGEPNQTELQLKISAKNFSGKALQGQLRVQVPGNPDVIEKIELKSGKTKDVLLRIPAQSADMQGLVRLDIADDIEIDNYRYFTYAVEPGKQVQIISPSGGALDFPSLALNIPPVQIQNKILPLPSDPENKMLILQSADDLSSINQELLRAFIRNGGTLAVTGGKSVELAEFLDKFGIKINRRKPVSKTVRRFGNINFDHPSMRLLAESGLSGWYEILFFQTINAEIPAQAEIIAEYNNGTPAIVELAEGKGRLIVFLMTFDRDASNWPGHYTFLTFWRELRKYCGATIHKDKELAAGASIDLPAEAQLTASGKDTPVNPTHLQPGNYLLKHNETSRYFSVNVPVTESNYTATSADWRQFAISSTAVDKALTPKNNENGERIEYYQYFILLCLLLVTGELLLSNRTYL